MKKIIFLLVLIINSVSFSYINIYPVKFEKDITKGGFEEYTLYNRTKKIRKYRIYIEEVPEGKGMEKWVEVYPRSITLEPLEEKSVQVYVEAPKDVAEGKYQANLVLKEVGLPATMRDEENKKKHNVLTMVKIRLKGIVKR